ncbi:tetraacyldisaccharide 4'-kinase [Bradyrhizobium sp. LHD-71]|uniref:tetraacyldisaccharide 4'-kinase n=1 Tax=Bradyrhizobium sp. LHD-71 TaxID=3072141 RepID=UPI00280E8043|nr:tetraacyldisaccharide 4'-kinase [Bradyrhizobium sp. LHD-71]MDQ8726808.1 tetraacyldisaccharide 4'-kinase [Bradyrhizobium sp. LHD-71]
MRDPAFWWRSPSWMSWLLAPAGLLYGTISGRRMLQAGRRARLPVICVGNYSLGGAGKTPTVIALLRLLRAAGETPVVVSRGYGGRLTGPVNVDAARHTAEDVGDEPLLLARLAPVIVSSDRVQGSGAAVSVGASVVVLDDGFQNPSLVKDLSLIVIDANRGIGNGAVFPSGPLRAPLAAQVDRTDALLVVGDGTAAADITAQVEGRGRPVLRAHIVPDSQAIAALRERRVSAFAGIGDPQRFFATLRASGIDVQSTRVFADHHRFTAPEIRRLGDEARADGLTLVTTEKDFVRLSGLEKADTAIIHPFPITLVFDDEARVRDFITTRLAEARKQIAATTVL